MNIGKKSLLIFLRKNEKFFIPFYQRNYDWTIKEINTLIDDVLNNKNDEYFLGSLMLKKSSVTTIVDGQQRISSLLLILKAISLHKNINTENKKEIETILNEIKFESKNKKDSSKLQNILQKSEIEYSELDKNTNYYKNFIDIKKTLNLYFNSNEKNINFLYSNLNKIIFSEIVVEEKDNIDEHKLFAQINSTGKKLTAYDLFKNHILYEISFYYEGSETSLDAYIDEKLEILDYVFDGCENLYKDDILRRYISYVEYNLPNKNDEKIYDAYKKLYDKLFEKALNKERVCINFFDNFYKYARIVKFIKEPNSYKKYIFKNRLEFFLNNLNSYMNIIVDIFWDSVTVDGKNLIINDEKINDIEESLKVLQIYKIRRSFCGMKEKIITRFVPYAVKLIRELDNVFSYAEKLYIVLYEKPNKKFLEDQNANVKYRMPMVSEFEFAFKNSEIYTIEGSSFCKEFFIFLSRSLGGKTNIDFSNQTVEHIYPQKPNLWIEENPNLNIEKMNQLLHTIGNLTITANNSNLSNEIFVNKKNKMFEIESSNLNNWIMKCSIWNEETILERAKYLYEKVNLYLNIDKLTESILKKSKPVEDKQIYCESFDEETYDQFKKNWIFFYNSKNIDVENVISFIKKYYVEKEIFGFDASGWLVKTTLMALGFKPNRKDNKEYIFDWKELDMNKVNAYLKMVESIKDNKEL